MINRFSFRAVFFLAAMTLAVNPAFAHHVMGGRTPATFLEGLISGLGHPIIGIDHLAFLVAVGVVVSVGGLSLLMPVIFVAASAVGVAMHAQGISIPAAEVVVASSVVLIGAIIARGHVIAALPCAGLFAAAGLFHGYAYGESIFGAENTPLGAYLLGLVIIQAAVAAGITVIVRRYGASAKSITPRLTGAVVGGIGLAIIAQQFIPS